MTTDIRLSAGRSAVLDWLPGSADTRQIAALLAGFANTSHGGTLLIGVSGDSFPQVEGIGDSAAAIDRILQAALTLLPPLILPLPTVRQIEGKPVLQVEIPAGMPNVYALEGRYLTREQAQTVPLHPRDLRRLLIERGEISFETEIAHNAKLADLNWTQVRAYISKLGGETDSEQAIHQFLIKRGCLGESSTGLRPTNAGMLLFGKDVQSCLRGTEITAVRFAGESMTDTFNRQDIAGTLPDQIRRAETFLRDHLRKEFALSDTMERQERFEYPLEAARELVVNAVAHRDYSITGDGIRLYLFKDRMEITSPGLLPGPVTVSNIVDERFSRNPALVQVLADMGFIERLGYGVDRVIELMRQQALRSPEFKETSGGFRAVLYNQLEPVAVSSPASVGVLQGVAEASPMSSPTVVLGLDPEFVQHALQDYRDMPLNPRQETALVFLNQPGNTRLTNSDLQKLYPDVHPETIRRDLSDMVTKALILKMGEKRGSYYVLKRDV